MSLNLYIAIPKSVFERADYFYLRLNKRLEIHYEENSINSFRN